MSLGSRSYPIRFAALSAVGESLTRAMSPAAPGKCVLVSNTVVGPLYRKRVETSLSSAGWNVAYCELKTVRRKTSQTLVKLISDILDAKIDRKTPIVALGGGVTTDI